MKKTLHYVFNGGVLVNGVVPINIDVVADDGVDKATLVIYLSDGSISRKTCAKKKVSDTLIKIAREYEAEVKLC